MISLEELKQDKSVLKTHVMLVLFPHHRICEGRSLGDTCICLLLGDPDNMYALREVVFALKL